MQKKNKIKLILILQKPANINSSEYFSLMQIRTCRKVEHVEKIVLMASFEFYWKFNKTLETIAGKFGFYL